MAHFAAKDNLKVKGTKFAAIAKTLIVNFNEGPWLIFFLLFLGKEEHDAPSFTSHLCLVQWLWQILRKYHFIMSLFFENFYENRNTPVHSIVRNMISNKPLIYNINQRIKSS